MYVPFSVIDKNLRTSIDGSWSEPPKTSSSGLQVVYCLMVLYTAVLINLAMERLYEKDVREDIEI